MGRMPSVAQERPVYKGFTERELREAFDIVKAEDNWKKPITVILDEGTYDKYGDVIMAAIEFFTGSTVTVIQDGETFIMKAAGYYWSVGA